MLNWKDNVARASRKVGGKYTIWRWPGGRMTWYGEIEEPRYDLRYIDRNGNDGKLWLPRGQPGTLAEAKQMAEEDHDRKLADIDKAKATTTSA
jgi:hypothetical protein